MRVRGQFPLNCLFPLPLVSIDIAVTSDCICLVKTLDELCYTCYCST
jgi:hypothetical protein